MTEFRVSGRSDLDAGEAGNGRRDMPMDVAMEMATVATAMAAETAGANIFELMERNENRKRRRWSEDLATPASGGATWRGPYNSRHRNRCRCTGRLDISQTWWKPGQPARRHSGWQR